MPAQPVTAAALDAVLTAHWPDAACELQARDPWELLVAAVLSARTSDQQVNKVMAVLNEHLVGVEAYARLQPAQLQGLLRKLPLHGQKARAVVEAARALLRHHQGRVPEDLDALRRLPGLGRKSAAVVAGNAWGIPAVAADVHVARIVHRLGWTAAEDPRAAEAAVAERFPSARWVRLCHQLIRLGRAHCRRIPKCHACPLHGVCPGARQDGRP